MSKRDDCHIYCGGPRRSSDCHTCCWLPYCNVYDKTELRELSEKISVLSDVFNEFQDKGEFRIVDGYLVPKHLNLPAGWLPPKK